MSALPTTAWGRLRFALKPASWPKLLVPAVIGLGLGVDVTGRFDVGATLVVLVLTVLDLSFVVCLNDWSDQEVDALKRRMFPESSPKTIPDGVLSARALLLLGTASGLLALSLSLPFGLLLERPLLPALVAIALAIFALYSLPPVRLNYRGGGELLEAAGVGVALPVLGSYVASGELLGPSAAMLPGWTLLALSSAIASGLSDESSDARGGKRTVVTMLGNPNARRLIEGLTLLGPILWLGAAYFVASGPPWPVAIFAGLTALDGWPTLRKRSALATTDAFGSIHAYKDTLHGIVWRSGLGWGIGLMLAPLVGQ